jgi:hypothetical protein
LVCEISFVLKEDVNVGSSATWSSEEEEVSQTVGFKEIDSCLLIAINDMVIEVLDSDVLNGNLLLVRGDALCMDSVSTLIKALFFLDD